MKIKDIPFIITERVSEQTSIKEAFNIMLNNKIRTIGVVNTKGEFKGIIRMEDIITLIINNLIQTTQKT